MLVLDGVEVTLGAFRLFADFTLPQLARAAVVGPSGGGKSTLLSTIAGFQPHRGQIFWQGTRIDTLAPARRPLTILFQDHNLFPNLTARDNVAIGIDPHLGRKARAEAEAALAAVGLAGFEDRRPFALSGGQAGRVALARALLRDRPLLLLDEPFAALGPGLRAEMLNLVVNLCTARRLTMLMVTHTPADALQSCPLTLVVDEGVAAPPMPTKALFASPPPRLALYLGQGQGPWLAAKGKGVG